VPEYSSETIRALRERYKISQAVLASIQPLQRPRELSLEASFADRRQLSFDGRLGEVAWGDSERLCHLRPSPPSGVGFWVPESSGGPETR